MNKSIFIFILMIFGFLANFQFVQAKELERRVFSVVLNKGNFSLSKSGMFVEFPVKKYEFSVDEFLRRTSGLSSAEKAFKNYLRNRPNGNKVIGVHMALHLGNLVEFIFTMKDSSGKATPGIAIFEKINGSKYRQFQGALPYHSSLTLISVMRTLIEPESYPPLPRDIVKSLGPSSIQYVMPFKDKGNPKPESIPKKQRIILYFKGHPFYLNILDKGISEKFLKKNPALAFYRQYLQALSSGIREEAYRYYWEPDTLKGMKKSIESMTKEEFKNYGRGEAEDGSEIRFLVDADPFYLIIYAIRKGKTLVKERWRVARVYKTPNDGYKMTNVALSSDDLTYLLFKTDFKTRVLRPKIKDHIKKIQKKK
jgi:hypothetical protein